MRSIVKHSAAGFGGLVFTLALSMSPALAELQVLSSNVPGIETGSTLSDDMPLQLPPGAVVRVLITPAGTTKTLKGPFKGTVASYKVRRDWVKRVMGPMRDPEPPGSAPMGGAREKGVKPEQ